MLTSGKVVLCVDARILQEYGEVLRRPTFDVDPRKADVVLEYIRSSGQVHAATPLPQALPDADDNPFLEVAYCAGVDCLVTGNLRHFPAHCRHGVQVLSPSAFIDVFRKRRTGRVGGTASAGGRE
jgi:predicted nucleic acid-binding protein